MATYGAWLGSIPTPDGDDGLDTSGKEGSSSDSLDCFPGNFLSFVQKGHASFLPLWPPAGKESTPSDSIPQPAAPSSETVINIDGGDDVRTEKRLAWIPDEDVRLVSAWLFHLNDPIDGNGKKADQYWGDVHATYNNTMPAKRKRKVKHLKDWFQKIKRWVGFFCGSWKKATSIYASGQSNDQLRDKALKFYMDDYKEGPFTVIHCWKVLRDEPKWHAVLDDIEKSNKRKLGDEGKVGENMHMPEDNGEKECPIRTKQAKKQRNGKGKIKDEDNLDEELHVCSSCS